MFKIIKYKRSKPCEVCHGVGKVRVDEPYKMVEYKDCTKCNGTGRSKRYRN